VQCQGLMNLGGSRVDIQDKRARCGSRRFAEQNGSRQNEQRNEHERKGSAGMNK
jgi:hypothetical protein